MTTAAITGPIMAPSGTRDLRCDGVGEGTIRNGPEVHVQLPGAVWLARPFKRWCEGETDNVDEVEN
jgi:hypothetical protein